MWFARDGDLLWLRTDGDTDWLRNLRAHPDAAVEMDSAQFDVRYEPSADIDADLRRLVTLWRAKYGPMWVQDWFVESGRVPVRLRLRS